MSAAARRGTKTIGSQSRSRTQADESADPAAESGAFEAAESHSTEAAEAGAQAALADTEETMQAAFERLARLVEIVGEQVGATARGGPDHTAAVDEARMAQALRASGAEAVGPRSAAALRSLEATLGRMAGHLDDAEDRTRDAVEGIGAKLRRFEADEPSALSQSSAPAMDAEPPAASTETSSAVTHPEATLMSPAPDERARPEAEADRAPSPLATASGRLDAAEIEQRLQSLFGSRFEGLERTISELREHVQAAERRGRDAVDEVERKVADVAASLERAQAAQRRDAETIEEVGAEVSRINHSVDAKISRLDSLQAASLETLGEKVSLIDQSLEARIGRASTVQALGVEKVSEEVSSIHKSVDAKLQRLDADQALALEKLGERMARTSERLAERIAATDWRSARAIEEVGEQMGRVAERLTKTSEKAQADLTDRLRRGEERIHRLIEEARDRLEREARVRSEAAAAFPGLLAKSAAPAPSPYDDDHLAGFPTAPATHAAADISAGSVEIVPEPAVAASASHVEQAADSAPQPFATMERAAEPDPAQAAPAPDEPDAFGPMGNAPQRPPSRAAFWRPFGRAN